MKEKTLNLTLEKDYRIIVISDIHGHLELFEALLVQVNLQADDHLIIIGDFINKGPDSLKMIHKMMVLEQRPNTYILKGNHEFFICHYLFTDAPSQSFLAYLKEVHFQSVIHDTLSQGGFDLESCEEMSDLIAWSHKYYGQEYNFINTLPVIAFADNMIFVHGGYDPSIDVQKDQQKLLKYDDFNNLSPINEATVIVGHWPTANLRRHRNTNTPYFNKVKNIITIDGGIGVKSSGELNALIIRKDNGVKHYDYCQSNHFKKVMIKAAHDFIPEEKLFINYPHFDIDVIEKGQMMTLCRHVQSGKELSIFNCLLEEIDGKVQVITTYINHFLNLDVGTEVELVKAYDDCALVKHNDEFGWVMRHQF